MTGAWRWSGHPISWKQTLSLHLWVDINLISLYCICILIFARLEKKSPEFPLERCSNSRQSAKPRLRTSSPVIRSIKTYHLLSSNHINISKQNICFHACLVNYFYILWFSGLSERLSTISKIVFSRFCFFSLHLNLSLLSSGFHPENRLVVYVSVNFSNFDKNVNFENLLATLTVFPHMSYCGLLPPTW